MSFVEDYIIPFLEEDENLDMQKVRNYYSAKGCAEDILVEKGIILEDQFRSLDEPSYLDISLARQSLLYFIKFSEESKSKKYFKLNWHQLILINEFHLQILKFRGLLDKEIPTVSIVSLPAGASKTMISLYSIIFNQSHHPSDKQLLITATDNLANVQAAVFDELVGSEIFNKVFSGIYLKNVESKFKKERASTGAKAIKDSSQAKQTLMNGVTYFKSISTVTGLRATDKGFLIIDDLILNFSDTESEVYMSTLKKNLYGSILSRSTNTTSIFSISTRFSDKDASGLLLEALDDATYINIPAISTIDSVNGIYDFRKTKDVIYWAMHSKKILLTKENLPEVFETLYQGNPARDSSNYIFNKNDFTSMEIFDESIHKNSQLVISVDTNLKKGAGNDCTAISVILMCQKMMSVIEIINRNMSLTEMIDEVKALNNKYRVNRILIEAKSNGVALAEMLAHKGIDKIQMVDNNMSKIEQAKYLKTVMQQNRFNIHEDYINVIRNQALSFTGKKSGSKDDIIDALSQASIFYLENYFYEKDLNIRSFQNPEVNKNKTYQNNVNIISKYAAALMMDYFTPKV